VRIFAPSASKLIRTPHKTQVADTGFLHQNVLDLDLDLDLDLECGCRRLLLVAIVTAGASTLTCCPVDRYDISQCGEGRSIFKRLVAMLGMVPQQS
jgi:hypothetical protein